MKYYAFIKHDEVVGVSTIPDETFVPPTEDYDLVIEITSAQVDTFNQDRLPDEAKVYAYTALTQTLEIVDRDEVPATIDKTEVDADGTDTVTISNLPDPTDVLVDETHYTVTDGSFEASFDSAGEYPIICRNKFYLNKEFTVNAS